MDQRVAFGGLTMRLQTGWFDITHEVEADDPPFTFAKADGLGALQISAALYVGGPMPMASASDLTDMLDDRCKSYGLDGAYDRVAEEGPLCVAGASYRADGDFVRMWYASDGNNFAFVSYTCTWDDDKGEVFACEAMVRTIEFVGIDDDQPTG